MKWNERTRNEKCFTCLQDKSTTLKLIPMLNPKQLLFSSNLLLKIIQENNSIFGISLSFFFFLFFFSLRNLFLLFISDFFFFEQLQQNKSHPHTCLLVYYHTNPKHKNIRSHYHRLANTVKQGWNGVGEQKKRLMSDQFKRGFLKFVFKWMVNILAMVLN